MCHKLMYTLLWSHVIMFYALASIGKFVPRVFVQVISFQRIMGKRCHVITLNLVYQSHPIKAILLK